MNRGEDLPELTVLISREEGKKIIELLEELSERRFVVAPSYDEELEVLRDRMIEAVGMTDPCKKCRGKGYVLGEYRGMSCHEDCDGCTPPRETQSRGFYG